MSEAKTRKFRVIQGKEEAAPIFEAAFVETLAIKRFLDFALADIKFQFGAMNKDFRNDKSKLLDAQATAILLSNYLQRLREGIEAMQPTSEA